MAALSLGPSLTAPYGRCRWCLAPLTEYEAEQIDVDDFRIDYRCPNLCETRDDDEIRPELEVYEKDGLILTREVEA